MAGEFDKVSRLEHQTAALEIREATEADLPGVLRVLAESGIDGGQSFTLSEAQVQYARLRRAANFHLLVAVAGAEIVGTYSLIIVEKLGKRGAAAGVVEDVAVLPARQGQGVGRAMMEHARGECRRAGCYKLALSSNLVREQAHRFYDSLGFERHGYSYVTRP
jgi:GNAT superfamily N-acetyltransferase